jgi:two-component system cell cycle sensor histidine kinase/response regulator CckA
LAKSLRKVRAETEVLYMSGYTDDKVREIVSVGVLRLITKPFFIEDLDRKIKDILSLQNPEETRKAADVSSD